MIKDTIDKLMQIETEDERIISAVRAGVDELEKLQVFVDRVREYEAQEREIFRKIGYIHIGCGNCANNMNHCYVCDNCENYSNYAEIEEIKSEG